MNAIILDFETSGVDPNVDFITEIGAMVVDSNWVAQEGFNQLVYDPKNSQLTPKIEKLTGITNELLVKEGVPLTDALQLLAKLVLTGNPDYFIAYNAPFDSSFFNAAMFTTGFQNSRLLDLPWLCAMADLEKNYECKSWQLAHVALFHGVTVDPKVLHRAMADVYLTRQMLEASGETLESLAHFAAEPWVYLTTDVAKPWLDGGKGAAAAKEEGFSWERAKGDTRSFPKLWIKRVKQKNVKAEMAQSKLKLKLIRE